MMVCILDAVFILSLSVYVVGFVSGLPNAGHLLQEMSPVVIQGNDQVTGHIISITIGSKNGKSKRVRVICKNYPCMVSRQLLPFMETDA